jgi:hypothetical protein
MSATTTDPVAIPPPQTLHGPSLGVPSLDESYRMTAEPDQRVMIKDVVWTFDEQLVDSIPPRAHMHVDYDGKDLDPDLSIEVDVSSPKIDRAGIYAALRILEVWRFDGEAEQEIIERLADDGTSHAVDESEFMPIRAVKVRRWVVDEDSDDEAAWAERLHAWIAAELAPRRAR